MFAFFQLMHTAWAATSIVPITAALAILVSSLQSAGGSFIALKCCWLGITWRRGTEHGMDEFSNIGISAALILGSTAIGAAIAGVAGSPLMPMVAGVGPMNEIVGDLVGIAGYWWMGITPGLYLKRRQLHGCGRRVWQVMPIVSRGGR